MAITALILGGSGFFFCAAFGRSLDQRLERALRSLGPWLKKILRGASHGHGDLPLITRLVASIRSGISLDSALEAISRDPAQTDEDRHRITLILEARPPKDFLSTFLDGALRSGIPLLITLQAFQKILQVERRVKMKASSLTSQSRAQAEVLSWLPWILLLALAGMDPEWFFSATTNAGSWFFWAISFGLLGLGRMWMKFALTRSLKPTDSEEEIREQILPDLTLRMISQLSLGQDAESALEACVTAIGDRRLKAQIEDASLRGESVATLLKMLEYSARTGAPLREDLMAFLSDLHLQIESRWEERVQRLPVVMMAPLFACFFPASLLVIASLLLPLLKEVM